jgi:hypothetical protein
MGFSNPPIDFAEAVRRQQPQYRWATSFRLWLIRPQVWQVIDPPPSQIVNMLMAGLSSPWTRFQRRLAIL